LPFITPPPATRRARGMGRSPMVLSVEVSANPASRSPGTAIMMTFRSRQKSARSGLSPFAGGCHSEGRLNLKAAGWPTEVPRPYVKLSIRPIMQSQRLWKVAGRNASQTLKGSSKQAFRPSHNHSVFMKSISESGARWRWILTSGLYSLPSGTRGHHAAVRRSGAVQR